MRLIRLLPFAALLVCAAAFAQPLTAAFTFQGQLQSAGTPANGLYDLRFRLYDALLGGAQQGPTLCSDNVGVVQGLFAVQLDFGAAFSGSQRFLEIDVRADTGLDCTSSAGFTTLGPRQALTAAPNADFALSAASALNAASLNSQPASFYTNAANISSGTIANARTSGTNTNAANTLVLRDASGNFSAGSISAVSVSGNGAGLVGLNASNISTGLLGDAFLSTNIPRLGAVNAFTGVSESFSGSVGIGTTTPGNKLELVVAGNGDGIRLTGGMGPTRSPGYHLYDGATQRGTLGLAEAATAFSTDSAAGDVVLRANTGKVLLQTGLGVSGLAISGTNVGIGTAAPTQPLHIVDSLFSTIRLERTGGAILTLSGQGSIGDIGTSNAFPFRLNSNGAVRMTLDTAGNVGIGTSTPSAPLHVVDGFSGVAATTGNASIVTERSASNFIQVLAPDTVQSGLIFGGPTTPVSAGIIYNGSGNPNGLQFRTGSNATHVTIDSSGRVGIGTTSPVTDLDIHGMTFCTNTFNGPDDPAIDAVISAVGPLVRFHHLESTPNGEVEIAVGAINLNSNDTVSYTGFNGSHYAYSTAEFHEGDLISNRGVQSRYPGPEIGEPIYDAALSAGANDPACLGVYFSTYGLEGRDNLHLVSSVGNANLWVVETGVDIAPGDNLITSDTAGMAMKDDEARFGTGHVIAKAADRVDWSKVASPAQGPKRARISVLLTTFDRGASEAIVKAQAEHIADLEARLRKLESILPVP